MAERGMAGSHRSVQQEKLTSTTVGANRKEDDAPIFTFNRFEPIVTLRRENRLTEITHMIVASNTLVVASNSNILFRTRLNVDLQPERILVTTRDDDSVAKLYMDPTGVHLFVFMTNGEAFYVNCNTASPKPKKMSRMQALGVTAMGFDQAIAPEQSATSSTVPTSVGGASPAAASTRPFLIGTCDGKLYECVIDTISGKEKVLNQVFAVSDSYPISDIHVECVGECQYPSSSFPSSSSASPTPTGLSLLSSVPSAASALMSLTSKMTGDSSSSSTTNSALSMITGLVYYIIITTAAPVRIHHFIGGPSFEALFLRYANNDINYTQLGSVDKCQIRCYRKTHLSKPDFFACKTDKGIYHGSLLIPSVTSSANFEALASPGSIIHESGLSDYPLVQTVSSSRKGSNMTSSSSSSPQVPHGIEITEFHFLMIGAFGFVSMSRLDSTRVTQISGCDRFDELAPISICSDSCSQTLWLCTRLNVYQIVKNNEDKHVWSTYLDWALARKGERHFDSAYQYCRTADQRDAVMTLRANYHMEQGDFEKAALYYGKVAPTQGSMNANAKLTSLERYAKVPPFELICIRFLDKKQRSALRIYLRERLKNIPQAQKIQRTMICTWMVEMFLGELNEKETLLSRVNGSLSTLRSKQPRSGLKHVANADDVGISNEIDLLSNKSEKLSDDIARLSQELISFLFDFRFNLETNTTLSILSSHGRRTELLNYARHMDSPDKVIKMLIYSRDYSEAIRFFSIEPLSKTTDLIYAYAPELMANMPERTTEMLKKKIITESRDGSLEIRMLLPTLFVYREMIASSPSDSKNLRISRFNEADAEPNIISTKLALDCSIRLLESVLFNASRTSFSAKPMDLVSLLALVVLYSESGAEDDIISLFRLMSSVSELDKSRLQQSEIGLVLAYCNRVGLWKSVVHALALTGKYETAVDCALGTSQLSVATSVHVDRGSRIALAKQIINNYAIKMISADESVLSKLRLVQSDRDSDEDDDDDGLGFDSALKRGRNDDNEDSLLDGSTINDHNNSKPKDDNLQQVFAIGGCGQDRLLSVLESMGLKSLMPTIESKEKEIEDVKISSDLPLIGGKADAKVRVDLGLSICKSLWTRVAQFIISCKYNSATSSMEGTNQDVVQPLLSLIKESGRILSVEDILPLLPNETEIDLIRKKIVKTLNNYNKKVSDLRKDVEQSAQTCQAIAQEIDDMQNRGMSMSSRQQCPLCAKEVLQRNIYLFPCSHAFHEDCLSSFVVSLMDPQQKDAVKELGKQIAEIRRQLAEVYRLIESQGKRSNLARQETKLLQRLELLQEELDGYLAAECPLCGLVMIQSVGTQLVAVEDVEEAMKWEI